MWKILIVDDDINMREMLEAALSRYKDYEVKTSKDAVEAISILKKEDFDLIISDYKMPHINGIEFLRWVKRNKQDRTQFMIMTAYGDIETAVEAMKLGAADFIEKNPDSLANIDILDIIVRRILNTIKNIEKIKRENIALKAIVSKDITYIGNSPQIKKILEEIDIIANTKSSVLITGETGTGKELIAKNIHYKSSRADKPFIKLNCAAIPETLIESELFGYEKGAFTGAEKTTKGKFELADGGTLLLDEIGEMPIHMQSKLLRVLQEKEIMRLGGSQTISIDVRIIATTNRDLVEEIKNGNFREDLFYRLNVIHFHLPPLRERKEDIPLLIEYFINVYNKENGLDVQGIEDKALKMLLEYNWPGNIRELQNVIERATIYTKVGKIPPEHIKLLDVNYKNIEEKNNSNDNENLDEFSFIVRPGDNIHEIERKLILNTLQVYPNKTEAAEKIGITVRTLRNKLNEYKKQGYI